MILGLAARNATRNVQRTMLTAGTVVLGTALLTVALAWQQGVFGGIVRLAAGSSGHVRVADPDYVQRENLFPLYENVPVSLVERIAAAEGVKSAYPRITAGVTITAGDEIGDVFGLAVGAPTAWYTEELDLDGLISEGRFLEGKDDIVLGKTVAERTGAKVGGEVVLLGQDQDGAMSPLKGTVVGIVSGGNALVDQQIYLPFERAAYMANLEDAATEILVYGPDRDDALSLKEIVVPLVQGACSDSKGGKVDCSVQAWSERSPWSGVLAVADFIQWTLSGIIVFITALGVWNTMMMSVLERTGEIGVLRALGLTRRGAVMLFVFEALAIACIGGLFGILLGGLGGWYLETQGIQLGDGVVQNVNLPVSSRMYGDLTPQTLVVAFVLGLVMAIAGSAVPALRAASIQPVAAMRARR